jgi:hypothetical protein
MPSVLDLSLRQRFTEKTGSTKRREGSFHRWGR